MVEVPSHQFPPVEHAELDPSTLIKSISTRVLPRAPCYAYAGPPGLGVSAGAKIRFASALGIALAASGSRVLEIGEVCRQPIPSQREPRVFVVC